MKLPQKLLNKLNGLHYPQEYLCLAKETFENSLRVYLVANGNIIKDITNEHLFVGYCPLVLSFSNIELPQTIDIIFSQQLLPPNEAFAKKDAIAFLQLRQVKQQSAGELTILYYEGINGKHHFQSGFHQLISSINNRLYNKKPGNVFLGILHRLDRTGR